MQMALLTFIGGVATWRIAHMFINENGPFAMFLRLRRALGVTYDIDGYVVSWKYEITTCIWCLSVWVGLVVALLLLLNPAVFMWFFLPFVFSGFAGLLDKLSVNK